MKHKFLILLPTYNRREMVKVSIESALSQDYTNYDLHIIDDNEFCSISEEVRSHENVSYVLSGDSNEVKAVRGSRHGALMNAKLATTDASIGIILCDDDALVKGYLRALNDYYQDDRAYSYCHVIEYDPTKGLETATAQSTLNQLTDLDPRNRVDASQVSWRIDGERFSETEVKNLDSLFYGELFNKHGACPFNGIVGQYKGVFPGQLGKREETYF